MSFNKVNKTIETFNVVSRGLGYKSDSDGFIIANRNLPMQLLLMQDTLTPVFAGMSDILFESLFPNENFKGLFPTNLEKRERALCFAVLKEKEDYNIENTSWSDAAAHCISYYIMKNVLMPNKHGKVELSNIINLWRAELAPYAEGDIIDLNNHRKTLIEYNMTMYPKIRDDLLEQRKQNFRKNIFN